MFKKVKSMLIFYAFLVFLPIASMKNILKESQIYGKASFSAKRKLEATPSPQPP